MAQIHLLDLWILMLFILTDVASSQLTVRYTHKKLCVFKSSSVDFNCAYDYPSIQSVKDIRWTKAGPNEEICVYHPDLGQVDISYRGRTEFAKEDKNCTLRLHNVSESDHGKYLFRVMTQEAAFTGKKGPYLKVAVLPFRVRMTSNRTDGFIQEGDTVNLTCNTARCTPSEIQLTWFKNRVPLPQVKSETLTFNSVLLSDSGHYSCGLHYNDSSTAPEILLDVTYPGWLMFMPAALGAVLLGLIFASVLFYFIKRKKQSSTRESTETCPNVDHNPGLEPKHSGSHPNMPVAAASEGIYDNLAAVEPQLTYAEIRFQQATSDRPSWTMPEETSIVYSTIKNTGTITQKNES